MRRRGLWGGGVLVLAVFGMGSMRVTAGQAAGVPPPLQAPGSSGARGERPDPATTRMEEQIAKGRNDERQKKLVADTAKLYELAGQLKDEVGKTDKNTLSLDVVKKAEEIEKLAKSVKDRMRG